MKHLRQLAAISIILSASGACNLSGDKDAVDISIVNNPASADEKAEASDELPKMEFKEMSFNFGKVKEGEKVTHIFKFRNTGKQVLLISSATSSCGCTVPEYPKDPIAVGGEGEIVVTFDTERRPGKNTKEITILSNTIPNTQVLKISAEVEKQ